MSLRQVSRPTRRAERVLIVRMWLDGFPARLIAMHLGTSTTTVYKWIRRFKDEGSVETRLRRSGTYVASVKFAKYVAEAGKNTGLQSPPAAALGPQRSPFSCISCGVQFWPREKDAALLRSTRGQHTSLFTLDFRTCDSCAAVKFLC